MNLDSNTVVITPHQEQAKMLSSTKRFILALAGVQGGKGLWEEEPVLTPTGYKKIKEIKVGDILFDRYGKETRVKEVYIRGEQNCYRFNFNDNKSIIVDEDHLWVIIDPHKRKERILSTRDLLTTHRMYWDTAANHACIPAAKISNKLKQFGFKKTPDKVIKNIESVGKRKSICIKVDSPTSTFIAKDEIVTHNTFGGCLWSQMRIQENPKGVGLITALSHDQLNNVVIDKFLQMFPPYRKFYRKGDKTIELPTGARIFFRSLEDPRYVEGISANWAWIDEADLVGFKGYLIIRGRVNATNGKVLMTSSIADNSWLADYLNKIDPNEMEVISWKSRDNPAFSNEEWESLKKELDPSLFRRRYEADLNFNSGLVYARFDKTRHILKQIPVGETVKKVFIGMDWGYVDPTTAVLIVYTESGKLYVVEEFGSESLDLDIIVAVVQKFIKLSVERWGKNPVIYADPSNKLFLKSVESRIHHSVNPNGIVNNDIFDGTSKIRNLIWQNRFFVLEHNKETLKELNRYRFKEKNWERKEEPEDKFNHYLDAVRYPIASYPIYSVGYIKKQKEQELPDFWKRRTPKYKRELERSRNEGNDFIDY